MDKSIIKSTWNCIRFPFLYPRNRWTGLHYNNQKIIDWTRRKIRESSLYVNLELTEDEIKGERVLEVPGGKTLALEIHGQEVWVVLSRAGGHWEKIIAKLIAPSMILDVAWGENDVINTQVKKLPETPRFIPARVIHNPWKWASGKIIRWIHDWPLQLFHCFTDHTELDSLEKGWRKAFGEDLCKDLRRALWKEGGLKAILRFRVTQIKEKFGSLRFYYVGGREEVWKVISKYENLSSKTCIVCGKPATYITTSWIRPYCDDCIGPNDPYQTAERIDENEDRD